MSRIRLSDGSSWPRPSDVGWVLRYGEPSREDMLAAAAIVSAYEYLLIESTRVKRDLVCREVRRYESTGADAEVLRSGALSPTEPATETA